MQKMCPWCFETDRKVVWLQQERPCRRCKFQGMWDDVPVFTHPVKITFPLEAEILARQCVETMLYVADLPRLN